MKFNYSGLKLLKEAEGCSLVSYQDGGGVWTIGYGSTRGVKPGMTITLEEAWDLLAEDINETCKQVDALLKVGLNENQYSAIICLTFNIGCGNLSSSTLLRLLNSGDFAGASNEFERWNKIKGVVSSGLSRRRKAEKELFLEPIDSVGQNKPIT